MSRLLAPLLIGLLGCGILLWLGFWQLDRLEWKRGVLAEIDARIAGAPQPLPDAPDAEAHRYRPVALEGEIGAEELHVLVSIKRKGAAYRVVSPFTTQGRVVLLDRGWVRHDAKAETRAAGRAMVSGNLHWPDDRNSSTPDNDAGQNIWYARDIAAMAEALGSEPVLVIAREITPDMGTTPLPVDSSGIPNDHQQYAFTWFSLAAIWALMSAIWGARRLKEH